MEIKFSTIKKCSNARKLIAIGNNKNNQKVMILELSNDEAIVLLEWLINFNQEEHNELFDDQSEKRVLWNLEALLEKSVPEILDPDYLDILAKARDKLRDDT